METPFRRSCWACQSSASPFVFNPERPTVHFSGGKQLRLFQLPHQVRQSPQPHKVQCRVNGIRVCGSRGQKRHPISLSALHDESIFVYKLNLPGIIGFSMNWTDLADLVAAAHRRFSQQKHLGIPLPDDRSRWQGMFREAEATTRAGVDAAVRRFARDRQWPETDAVEQYFLFQRLDFVQPLVLLLAVRRKDAPAPIVPNPPAEFDDETQIEWLLNVSWEVLGVFEWVGRLETEIADYD